MDVNDVSSLVRSLSGAFGGRHPIRAAIGVALGLATKIVIYVAAGLFPDEKAFSLLGEFNATWYAAIWVGILFAPVVFGRYGAPETVILQFNTVDELIRRAGLGPAQARLIWHGLISRYLEALEPDFSQPPSITELLKEVSEPPKDTDASTTS
jgi:hypothetical protein